MIKTIYLLSLAYLITVVSFAQGNKAVESQLVLLNIHTGEENIVNQ